MDQESNFSNKDNEDLWHSSQENILREWAEKARYYAWMNHKTSTHYSKLNNFLTVPLIVLSTLSGSANFALIGGGDEDECDDNLLYDTIFPFIIGIMSMITAVLSSLLKFLKTAELADKHEDIHKQYNKFVRNICLDLSLPPEQRKKPIALCNYYRQEFDRLMNDNPSIPNHIIAELNTKFPTAKYKPDIANTTQKISIYGRKKRLEDIQTSFQKVRLFYKWLATVKNNKRPSLISIPSSNYTETPNKSYNETPKKKRGSFSSMFKNVKFVKNETFQENDENI
jgi:hypothetical protein